MTWHWTYKTLPELAGLTDDEKRRLWERCRGRVWRRPVVWAAVAAHAALMIVVPRLLFQGRPDLAPGWLVFGLACSAAAGGGGAVVMSAAVLHAVRPYLLRERPGRCRGCGYDLTGNASGVCPECGRAATV